MTIKSSCCNAPVTVEGDDTHYYVCGKCRKACDEQETPLDTLINLRRESEKRMGEHLRKQPKNAQSRYYYKGYQAALQDAIDSLFIGRRKSNGRQ